MSGSLVVHGALLAALLLPFGGNAHRKTEQGNRHYVEEALTIWEPRIDNIEVKTEADADLGRIVFTIHYRIRSSNTFYNLVYPFYLIEAGSEAGS